MPLFSQTLGECLALYALTRVDSGTIYYLGLAFVAVVVTVALVVFYRTWTEVSEDEEPDSPEEVFDSFVEAHAAGEIDDEELERVRKLLVGDRPDSGSRVMKLTRPTRGTMSGPGGDSASPDPETS